MESPVSTELEEFLNQKVLQYNQPSFIKDDPIAIPHLFKIKQDIEIAAFFAAIFAWGNRTTIINKSLELLALMSNAPYDFVRNHSDNDLKTLLLFKHRTFNTTDLLYFIDFLKVHYSAHESLETAFTKDWKSADENIENALNSFYGYFFSLEHFAPRTRKHIAAPFKGSTCKRLNMFLRWMVRKDNKGVDFGIWKGIRPYQLIIPIDIHVARVARSFGLLTRNAIDWQAAVELTANLRRLDSADPVKYDFALFGLGVAEKF
ncbi:MAG: TIGR02757 family protein [Gemmatimonadaceae bacterium]|nr:TIGR02757 family protein [Chitinophagaceae bacterium]